MRFLPSCRAAAPLRLGPHSLANSTTRARHCPQPCTPAPRPRAGSLHTGHCLPRLCPSATHLVSSSKKIWWQVSPISPPKSTLFDLQQNPRSMPPGCHLWPGPSGHLPGQEPLQLVLRVPLRAPSPSLLPCDPTAHLHLPRGLWVPAMAPRPAHPGPGAASCHLSLSEALVDWSCCFTLFTALTSRCPHCAGAQAGACPPVPLWHTHAQPTSSPG